MLISLVTLQEMVYYNVVIESQISQMCFSFSKGFQMTQHLHFYRIIPKLSTCFNCAKVLTLPCLVLKVAGFILSNSNRPRKIFPSSVINR